MGEHNLYEIALKKAMSLCAGREICRSEIKTKLHSWGVDERSSESIISRLVKENFIDEVRYASAFVIDKFRYNRWGRVKIAAAMRAKSLSPEIINEALALIDDETYIELMKDLISDHRKKIKAKNQFDLKGKLLRFGLSRGFESHLLYDLLNESD